MNSLISPDTTWVNTSAKNLIQRYQKVRQTSVDLCKPLKIEDYVVQPVDFVSPPKWNLAHVTWFFETFILKPYFIGYQEFNPEFGYFFNSYYESIGQRTLRAQRGNMTRPSTEEMYAYRKYVDEAFVSFLAQNPELPSEIYQIIELGLHHEQQHQELLLTDLKYILGHNPLFPKYKNSNLNYNNLKINQLEYLSIAEGIYEIGYTGQDFCFDNELGVHKVYLASFQIANRLISNAEYLEFMEAGGYQKFHYWLGAGWDWVKQNQINAPMYWYLIDNQWFNYTLSGLQKVNLNEPVTHISFFEADAYARWAGKRLATEFEWEIACRHYSSSIPQTANFLETNKLQPVFLQNNYQFYGDCWEWTNSAYLPYPYYKQAEGALGEYNGKFMINQMVLRGGSCATPISHIRPTYRNFFHTHERWQFTGIRLAEYN